MIRGLGNHSYTLLLVPNSAVLVMTITGVSGGGLCRNAVIKIAQH